ncbi:hypothetical protein GCM10010390_58190 [Streptomyces mordarskii]|uniref:Uncharacterized protein n=1 Tax=Streptomyces mordarskii TaxID=1226758 RepID=A0ABP3NR69_9ACTN
MQFTIDSRQEQTGESAALSPSSRFGAFGGEGAEPVNQAQVGGGAAVLCMGDASWRQCCPKPPELRKRAARPAVALERYGYRVTSAGDG